MRKLRLIFMLMPILIFFTRILFSGNARAEPATDPANYHDFVSTAEQVVGDYVEEEECWVYCSHGLHSWIQGPFTKEKAKAVIKKHIEENPTHDPWYDCD